VTGLARGPNPRRGCAGVRLRSRSGQRWPQGRSSVASLADYLETWAVNVLIARCPSVDMGLTPSEVVPRPDWGGNLASGQATCRPIAVQLDSASMNVGGEVVQYPTAVMAASRRNSAPMCAPGIG